MDITENGYTLSIVKDPGPNGKWYRSSYPKLKKPQGPYDDSYSASEDAKAWARKMPKQG